MNSERLKEFRQAAYELLIKAKDATFELMDAVMTTRNAAAQLKQVCEQTKNPVLAVLDREYGNATWVLAQADIPVDCLMRVRRNACCWSAPPAYRGRGRPRKHGEKIKLNDSTTWTEADETLEIEEHPQLGQVRVRQWKNLHFYRAAGHPVNLMLVERMKLMSNGQPFPPLWLAWVGERTLPLATVWLKYLRRFGVDHWYRFAKQRLHWTLPNLSTPEQSERWSDLMPLMSWQLWQARDLVVENRLPWQSATIDLTPGRVAQSMLALLVEIGTPAQSPKPRGKSPGWEKGNARTKSPRYPTVKKRVSRPKKSPKVAD